MTPRISSRERQVLALIVDGYSAKEIAQKLRIAPRTVESHTYNIRDKLGARNRAQMAAISVRDGHHLDPALASIDSRFFS